MRLNLGLLPMNQVGRAEDAQGEIEMACTTWTAGPPWPPAAMRR
ncbi:hypothetical protein [Actinokineospora sp.]